MKEATIEMDIEIGNTDIMFVRVHGRLVPIENVNFVQISPQTGKITQDIPLKLPINRLMWYNTHSFVKSVETLAELNSKDTTSVKDPFQK